MSSNPQEAPREVNVTWDDPRPSAEAARRVAGLEFLRAIRDDEIAPPPIGRLIGFKLTEVEPGRAVFECAPSEAHYNPIGSVHGGVISTLLDSALSCAVHTTLPAGTGYMTVNLNVTFVRPVLAGTTRIRCEGRLLHGGRRIATAEARLLDDAGRLYAHATGTCLILVHPLV